MDRPRLPTSNTTGLVVGANVTGTGIAAGTTIQAVNSTSNTVTLSKPATGSGVSTLAAAYPRIVSANVDIGAKAFFLTL